MNTREGYVTVCKIFKFEKFIGISKKYFLASYEVSYVIFEIKKSYTIREDYYYLRLLKW